MMSPHTSAIITKGLTCSGGISACDGGAVITTFFGLHFGAEIKDSDFAGSANSPMPPSPAPREDDEQIDLFDNRQKITVFMKVNGTEYSSEYELHDLRGRTIVRIYKIMGRMSHALTIKVSGIHARNRFTVSIKNWVLRNFNK